VPDKKARDAIDGAAELWRLRKQLKKEVEFAKEVVDSHFGKTPKSPSENAMKLAAFEVILTQRLEQRQANELRAILGLIEAYKIPRASSLAQERMEAMFAGTLINDIEARVRRLLGEPHEPIVSEMGLAKGYSQNEQTA